MSCVVTPSSNWGAFVASRGTGFIGTLTLGIFLGVVSVSTFAQTVPAATAAQKVQPAEGHAAGDALDNPGPLATGLSSEIKPKAIAAAMKKVADWQVAYAEPNFNKQWTFAALYDGLLAASKATGNPKYRDAVLHFSEQSDWTLLDNRFPHADDQALGKAYMELYLDDPKASRQPVRMANTKEILDRLVVRPDDPDLCAGMGCLDAEGERVDVPNDLGNADPPEHRVARQGIGKLPRRVCELDGHQDFLGVIECAVHGGLLPGGSSGPLPTALRYRNRHEIE